MNTNEQKKVYTTPEIEVVELERQVLLTYTSPLPTEGSGEING
jgi:hypothetical protein